MCLLSIDVIRNSLIFSVNYSIYLLKHLHQRIDIVIKNDRFLSYLVGILEMTFKTKSKVFLSSRENLPRSKSNSSNCIRKKTCVKYLSQSISLIFIRMYIISFQTLISLPEQISQSRPVWDFFQLLPTDVQNPSESSSNNKKSLVNNAVDISGPAKLPTYRCVDNFTAVEKTEMSLKRNTLVQVVQKHLNGSLRNANVREIRPSSLLRLVVRSKWRSNGFCTWCFSQTYRCSSHPS